MRFSIFVKLFISLIVVGLVTVLLAMAVIMLNFRSGLQQFVNQQEHRRLTPLIQQLAQHYQQHGDWNQLNNQNRHWQQLLGSINHVGKPINPASKPPLETISPKKAPSTNNTIHGESPPLLPLNERLSLLDAAHHVVVKQKHQAPHEFVQQHLPIVVNGNTVGYLQVQQRQYLNDAIVAAFVHQQTQGVLIAACAALLVAIGLAYLLVRHFLRPLNALTAGADALSKGQLDYRIDVDSSDELGILTQRFNALATTLQQQKQTRDHWLSDISHELRTPLAVLRSEIEALQDGIRQPEPRYIHSLHHQVDNLSRLVEDLHALSLSEIDEPRVFERLDLSRLLSEAIHRHSLRFSEKSIHLQQNIGTAAVMLSADRKGLNQVLDNLLQNSYRYTQSGGKVIIALHDDDNHVVITVDDSTPGVPDEALPRLFDRLYRVDKSRTRLGESAGGSGLGLAIAQKIIIAHGGNITASHSRLGGVTITITLPKKRIKQ